MGRSLSLGGTRALPVRRRSGAEPLLADLTPWAKLSNTAKAPKPLAGPLPLSKRMCHGPRPPPPRLPEPSPGFSPGSWAFLPGAFLSFSALPTSGLLNPKVTPTPEVVGRRSGPPPLECSSQKRKKKKNVCVISEINHRGWYP